MKQVLFLHGALGSKVHWNKVLPILQGQYELYYINFPQHGSSTSEISELDQKALITFVRDFIRHHQLTQVYIVGYSLGGYIALQLAIAGDLELQGVITLATKLRWSQEIVESEIAKLTEENLNPIAAKLQQEHGKNWRRLIPITNKILRSIGESPITTHSMSSISIPVYMLLGDKDKMVSKEETFEFAEANKRIFVKILPDQGHLLERMEAGILANTIDEILIP